MAAGGGRGCTKEGRGNASQECKHWSHLLRAECRVGGGTNPPHPLFPSFLLYSVLPSFPHFHFLLSLPGDSLDRQHWGEWGKGFLFATDKKRFSFIHRRMFFFFCRLCSLTLTRLVLNKSLGSDLSSVLIAVKMQVRLQQIYENTEAVGG